MLRAQPKIARVISGLSIALLRIDFDCWFIQKCIIRDCTMDCRAIQKLSCRRFPLFVLGFSPPVKE